MTQQQISKLTGVEATKLMSIKRNAPSPDNITVNLYDDFGGAILYNKMEGMDSVGESKNAYTEEYADAEQLRTYMPDVVHNKATTVKLTLDFIGENRSFIKDTFIQFIKKGVFTFFDRVRGRKFDFVFIKSSEPREDVYKGSVHYIEITFELQNIKGKTEEIDATLNRTYYSVSSTPAANNRNWKKVYFFTTDGSIKVCAKTASNDYAILAPSVVAATATYAALNPELCFNVYGETYVLDGTTDKYRYVGNQMLKIL